MLLIGAGINVKANGIKPNIFIIIGGCICEL